MQVEGRERLIVFVAGPNARGRVAYPKTVTNAYVGVVRKRLALDRDS
jgi:hypothetical protein